MNVSRRRGIAAPIGTTSAIVLLLAALIASIALPAQADTTLHRNGFREVPAQKIIFDNLDLSKATVSGAIPGIKRKSVHKEGETSSRSSIVLHVQKGNTKTIASPFSVRFNNAGYDVNGNRVDLLMQCDKLVLQPYRNQEVAKGDYILMRNTALNKSIGIFAWCIAGQANRLGIQQDYTVKVLKHGTNTPCGQPLLMYTTDLDTRDLTGETPSYDGAFAESLTLLSGYLGDTYVIPDTTLKATDGNTRFHGTAIDTNTDKSAVVCSLGAKGGKIRWSGTKCGTNLFKAFTRTIKSSAKTGGTIDPAGSTSVLWRNDLTFKITANKHFDIADVLVDGKSVGAKTSYTFKDVTDNHTIVAQFSPHPYQLSFDLNGQEGTAPDAQTLHYQDKATQPTDPSAPGLNFKGWYKDREGKNVWNFETDTMPGADVTLYAKWEPITHIVTFVDPDGKTIDTQTVPDGGDATAPDAPTIDGKTFTGWDKDFTHVTEDLVVTAQYEDAPTPPSTSSSTEPSSSASTSSATPTPSSSATVSSGHTASTGPKTPAKVKSTSSTTADKGYAKTGNPFRDWWWAFALAGTVGAVLIGYGIYSSRRSSRRR